jgi:hypothetical protein
MTKTFTEKYDDYGFIKVRSFTPDPDGCKGELKEHFREFEDHHIEETEFLIKEVRGLASLLDLATCFTIPVEISGGIESEKIEVKSRGYGKWAVIHSGLVLNHKTREWEVDPLPSSRDSAFFARCYYDDLFSALKDARKKAKVLEKDLQDRHDAYDEKKYPAAKLKDLSTIHLRQMLRNNNVEDSVYEESIQQQPRQHPSSKQLKAELATREHIPNKEESKAKRQEAAKQNRGQNKSKGR